MSGSVSGIGKGIRKAEVSLKWDPSPMGQPDVDLDLVAATYRHTDPHGEPVYVVHFDSRSPDGTITLHRDSRDGKGFGWDEVMTLELDRLAGEFGRVVVGAVVQQGTVGRTFAQVPQARYRVAEGYATLTEEDFAEVGGARAATLCEFVRAGSRWEFRPAVRGFQDPEGFPRIMGAAAGG
ncbi:MULTISPECIES: TerD family protein [Streptomyces]|uniref:TerD family protein n=1 Tax=Streptomyces TaxID=1883 RepID=UPI000AA91BB5|nr:MULTISPECIES: TerD family protein [Streptomyces]MDH6224585.1 stress response protein SCP2 [Streptomyces sp. MJP52]